MREVTIWSGRVASGMHGTDTVFQAESMGASFRVLLIKADDRT